MARKVGNEKMMKTAQKHFCDCGAEKTAVQYRGKGKKGMFWVCKNGHEVPVR